MPTPFSIAAVQIASTRGDIAANVTAHVRATEAAAAAGVDVIVFPELSITGYEPDLAAALTLDPGDARLVPLRRAAGRCGITLTAGAPVANGEKPAIGAFVFTPDGGSRTYRKMHLGSSEAPYFSHGAAPLVHDTNGHRLAVAVCADSTHRSHAERYRELGATIYASGVFLTADWYAEDAPRLQAFARDLGMLTAMANHGASAGTYRSAGMSAVWAPGGAPLAQAAGTEDALVIARFAAGSWTGAVSPLGRV